MESVDSLLVFQHLGLEPKTIQSMQIDCDDIEELKLRLLLKWLKTDANPTYQALVDAFGKQNYEISIKDVSTCYLKKTLIIRLLENMHVNLK